MPALLLRLADLCLQLRDELGKTRFLSCFLPNEFNLGCCRALLINAAGGDRPAHVLSEGTRLTGAPFVLERAA